MFFASVHLRTENNAHLLCSQMYVVDRWLLPIILSLSRLSANNGRLGNESLAAGIYPPEGWSSSDVSNLYRMSEHLTEAALMLLASLLSHPQAALNFVACDDLVSSLLSIPPVFVLQNIDPNITDLGSSR